MADRFGGRRLTHHGLGGAFGGTFGVSSGMGDRRRSDWPGDYGYGTAALVVKA